MSSSTLDHIETRLNREQFFVLLSIHYTEIAIVTVSQCFNPINANRAGTIARMEHAPREYSTDELISQRVNHLLFINRMTRRKAAGELGISHSAFNTKINGGSSWKADELASLTDHFGVSFDFLIGRQAIEMAAPIPQEDEARPQNPPHA